MAERYVNVDRETPMLLPPDLRDWVADNDLARLVLECVELCDASAARTNTRGTGSEQYPPTMMLALLIYSYATGIFSSRRIERASYDSVAVRYLCGNHHPDHDTIAQFRRGNLELFKNCFGRVLLMAREAGVLKLGAVAIDGTRLAGAGSRNAVRTFAQIESELEALGEELCQKAEAADRGDRDGEGTQIPGELADAALRREKLLAAKASIEQRRREAAEAGRRDEPGSARRCNKASVSEPDSRTLRRCEGEAVQGYNAQMATDAGPSGLIVGAQLGQGTNDGTELENSVAAIAPEAGTASALLIDKGYDNTEAIERVESRHRLLVLCPPQRRLNTSETPRKRRGRVGWVFEKRRAMEARLATPELAALYRRRKPTAEGVFARIKSQLGFRRFGCWGLSAARAEWSLVCLAHNLRVLVKRLVN